MPLSREQIERARRMMETMPIPTPAPPSNMPTYFMTPSGIVSSPDGVATGEGTVSGRWASQAIPVQTAPNPAAYFVDDWGITRPIDIGAHYRPTSIGNPSRTAEQYRTMSYYDTADIRNNMEMEGDWHPTEFKDLAKKKNVITLEAKAANAIEEIINELVGKQLKIIRNMYELRLDMLDNSDYNALTTEFEGSTDNTADHSAYRNLKLITKVHDIIKSGKDFSPRDYSWVMQSIEHSALRRYDKNHSKYKYYPRLMAKIKYGDAELLAIIFSITRMSKGRVVCK